MRIPFIPLMNVVNAPLRATLASKPWICSSCRALAVHNISYLAAQSPNNRSREGAQYRIGARTLNIVRPQRRNFTVSHIQQHAAPTSSERRDKLPDTPARTRFAPSPTGFMHIGGLRTALFSYLLARRTQGQFILRIEDTDQKRLVEGAEQRIFDDLQWAGIQWDEGPIVGGPHGPYKQSERNDVYYEYARQLLDSGAAYRCFCTPQTAGQASEAFVTSGCYEDCSSLPADESLEKAEGDKAPFTVRLLQPSNVHKRHYPDLIYGKIKRLKRSRTAASSSTASADDGGESGLDAADTILVKSDGSPTYHFANVVDDHLMQITHVIRGTEWMASTPLHYDLYTAFGWEPPEFAHVGLLLDKNQAKLSKRSGNLSLDVQGLRTEGVLPETLINFLVLLGWSNPRESDVMNLRTMIECFDLKFTTGNTVCDTKKLWFLQKQHVQQRCLEAKRGYTNEPIAGIVGRIEVEVVQTCGDKLTGRAKEAQANGTLRDFCQEILLEDDKGYQTPRQWVEKNDYFFSFDATNLPELSEVVSNDGGLPASQFQSIINGLFSKSTLKFAGDPDDEPLFPSKTPGPSDGEPKSKTPPPLSQVTRVSDRIHAALHKRIWLQMLSRCNTPRQTASLMESFGILPAAPAIDVAAYARHYAELICPDTGDAGDIGELAVKLQETHKAYNKAVMKWLRLRLCYGKPGPAMGVVMALLGPGECARRLCVDVQDEA